jgi:sugar lactone lactonase YvrE
LLGKIVTPERPANMAWGDEDGKTLYLTAHTSLYKVRVNTGGKFSENERVKIYRKIKDRLSLKD